MSPVVVGGPALFIGGDATYVALLRPLLDPSDPGVRQAAEQAGVSPEEFAGPGNVWTLMADWEGDDDEGGGFELPGMRDSEAEHFADQLSTALGSGEAFTIEAGSVLQLDARPVEDGYAFLARVTPPEPEGSPTLDVEIEPVPTATLLADLEEFRRTLA
ncbi:hypothetical protein [Streptomyces sp. NBC_00347]|uniref:hypothetical protein n=1 Tax=Streptomyces sp. NBC_00347 TaxID=2975721 RepID=UPI0022532CB6|nr:hypothetical protein [Streptomyces sp. NBC_00347]MCX5123318.1 hypothetical protein [Streptomyces sp. NBC_00347]